MLATLGKQQLVWHLLIDTIDRLCPCTACIFLRITLLMSENLGMVVPAVHLPIGCSIAHVAHDLGFPHLG